VECHPVCNLFPPMSQDEFGELCKDIAKHGQLVPIWTYQDQIIDGRHRWRACTLLGKAPAFQEWDGEGSLVEFVVGLNLHRRHLDTSQRALLATGIVEALKDESDRRIEEGRQRGGGWQKRSVANLPQSTSEPETVCEADPPEEWKARNEAARMANVSPRLVQDALKIKTERPDLADAVMRGEKTVHGAMAEMKGRDSTPRPYERARPKPHPEPGGEWLHIPNDPTKAVAVLKVHFGNDWLMFTAAIEAEINAN
jgi:hypothetical protein